MSARVYCMKTVNGCKDVSIMSLQDEQVYSVCKLSFSCFTKYNRICSQNINKQIVNIAKKILRTRAYTEINLGPGAKFKSDISIRQVLLYLAFKKKLAENNIVSKKSTFYYTVMCGIISI